MFLMAMTWRNFSVSSLALSFFITYNSGVVVVVVFSFPESYANSSSSVFPEMVNFTLFLRVHDLSPAIREGGWLQTAASNWKRYN